MLNITADSRLIKVVRTYTTDQHDNNYHHTPEEITFQLALDCRIFSLRLDQSDLVIYVSVSLRLFQLASGCFS